MLARERRNRLVGWRGVPCGHGICEHGGDGQEFCLHLLSRPLQIPDGSGGFMIAVSAMGISVKRPQCNSRCSLPVDHSSRNEMVFRPSSFRNKQRGTNRLASQGWIAQVGKGQVQRRLEQQSQGFWLLARVGQVVRVFVLASIGRNSRTVQAGARPRPLQNQAVTKH